MLFLIPPVLADRSRAVLPRVQRMRRASSVSVRLGVAVVEVVGEPEPVDSQAFVDSLQGVDSLQVVESVAAESASGRRELAEV